MGLIATARRGVMVTAASVVRPGLASCCRSSAGCFLRGKSSTETLFRVSGPSPLGDPAAQLQTRGLAVLYGPAWFHSSCTPPPAVRLHLGDPRPHLVDSRPKVGYPHNPSRPRHPLL
ncbi:hypothetical protein PF005_g27444 [Phytophthora fragariae]|uniref:Uncharacterized protein n=1 Tax=Phytophthora fragariae TaxID=53985 RepID=A0A6A3VNT1_9STRA|nr:hypothetical protein PF003_g23838 [Phytophthora fragariae]KAE8921777.1 hypothetical protein PF009_g27951 [Phytophthora fragariae]KAE9069892.1 hypothetical protein PF007_g27146 [Phytophthora fragariae]KAE9083451.1 hypothetical protein PF006_g26689 [Phytophthora fragariae]KAE9170733.1 hypothetical protein PF005_g27444 [Phytophthora fragariae]